MSGHLEKKRRVAQKAAEEIVRSDPEALGVMLVCSVATGRARPDSDIDLTVFTVDKRERREFRMDGEEIDVHFTPLDVASGECGVEAAWSDQQAKVYAEGLPLVDPKGALKRLQDRFRDYTLEKRRETFDAHLGYARAFLEKARRELNRSREGKSAGWAYQSILFAWCAVFPLNGRFRNDWLPNLDITRDFPLRPEEFEVRMSRLLDAPEDAKELERRAARLLAAARQVLERGESRFGGPGGDQPSSSASPDFIP